MSSSRRPTLTALAVFAFAATALTLSACGWSSDSKSVAEGEPVKLGDLQYNVVFSRLLNPHDAEDAAYLVGQPAPPRNGSYFGVFLQVQNDGKRPQGLPRTMTITDAGRQLYTAIPSTSLYALPLGGKVDAEDQQPVLDSTPQQGSIEGSLVLFKLPDETSDNRPLTLHIPGPDGPAEVKLDL
jgi:hypothetical protein